ncbi:MAG: Flp pilus assembly complex ATPase component TadA [Candidatus Sericytochromatia bacterium]|nr:Flp pilus assembly complex ATPase component TadA [Candidatus Tanganyikabacteria bacterium]
MAVYGKRLRLGEILTRAGVISDAQLQVALAKQQITREPIGEILIGLGYVTSDQIRNALELQYGVKAITLSTALNLDLVKLLPEAVIRRLRVVPVAIGQLTLAMVDPANMAAVEEVKNRFKGVNIQPVVITESEFKDFMANLPASDDAMEGAAEVSIDDASAAQLVHVLLSNALARGATEILLEPEEFETRIRMRIDGYLVSEPAVPGRISSLLINRLRVLCDLGQAQALTAQAGSFHFPFEGRKIKATFHSLPVKHGQLVTVRFFDPVRLGATTLAGLIGLAPVAERLAQLLMRPSGLILVNGPQHPVKTGLLYASLKQAAEMGRGVVSLEPVIEHELEGISQIHAGSDLEGALSLPVALKTVLDHGHDVLAVWDLADPDSARRLVRAALGGRLVIASWNTTERFLEEALETWGLPARTIANALAGIVNVRAVRALCTACRRDVQPPGDTHPLVLRYNDSGRVHVPGEGCERCGYRGFRGQVGVFEVFPLDRPLRNLIAAGIDKARLDTLAEEEGFVPLANYAAWLVGQGIVTWNDVAASGIFDDLPPINSESVLV